MASPRETDEAVEGGDEKKNRERQSEIRNDASTSLAPDWAFVKLRMRVETQLMTVDCCVMVSERKFCRRRDDFADFKRGIGKTDINLSRKGSILYIFVGLLIMNYW